jgi:hypothetical protein
MFNTTTILICAKVRLFGAKFNQISHVRCIAIVYVVGVDVIIATTRAVEVVSKIIEGVCSSKEFSTVVTAFVIMIAASISELTTAGDTKVHGGINSRESVLDGSCSAAILLGNEGMAVSIIDCTDSLR